MSGISITHDPRSPWIFDRAALEKACQELEIESDSISFRQVYGMAKESDDLGSSNLTPLTGEHEIQIDASLHPVVASGVTWHELGHAADHASQMRQRKIDLSPMLCDALGVYEEAPHEIRARECSRNHRDVPLTLTVRRAAIYTPSFNYWDATLDEIRAEQRSREWR